MSAELAMDFAAAMDVDPSACDRCGEIHDRTRCDGHSRQGEHAGRQCGNARGQGTDHPGFGRCKFHLGSTEQGRRFAEAEAERVQLTLVMGAPEMLRKLNRMTEDDGGDARTKLHAILAWLDRSGVAPKGGGVSVAVGVSVTVEERQAELLERAKAIRAGVVLDAGVGAEADH